MVGWMAAVMPDLKHGPSASVTTDAHAPLPYAGPKGIVIALVAAIALCWPMLFTTAPLGYFDTASYQTDGEAAVQMVHQVLAPLFTPPASDGLTATTDGALTAGRVDGPVVSIRSAAYSVFVFAASGTAIGLVLPVILQTAMTLYLFLAWVPRPLAFTPIPTAIGFAGVGLATTLPWFASYAMPDILVAAMVLYFAILLGAIDQARGWQVIVIGAIGTFAVLSHYANPPLALALCCAILGWRTLTRRLTWQVAVMAIIPVLLPVPINMAANMATDSGPSIAPKRLPLVLARSLEDGPARWYLAEACDTEGYAICELFDEIPDNLGAFLWSDDGISSATDGQLRQIQEQEFEILVETMKAYPLAQTRALLGNAALQMVSVGTGQILPRLPDSKGVFPTATDKAEEYRAIGVFDVVVKVTTAFGVAALLALAALGRLPGYIALTFALVLFATVVNGAVFGGLSAPVDRYQSRFAWLFPALAVVAWIDLTGRNRTAREA